MMIRMSSKGQIVIPAALRRKLGLTPQTQIRIDEKDGVMTLQPVTREQIDRVKGMLKGSGVYQAMLDDREWERKNDERRTQKWSKTASSTRQR